MNNCNGECSTCKSTCGPTCPVCKAPGMSVPAITVASLTNKKVNLDKNYYLCLRPNCDNAYFDEDGNIINKVEVKTPIWFKSKYDEYIVCYCRDITLKDVVKAVFELHGTASKKEVIAHLNKTETTNECILKNPTGKSCEQLFDNAIIYATNLYKQKEEKR